MELGSLIYAACSASFLTLIGLVVLRGRISGIGIVFTTGAALTALWAANLAAPGYIPAIVGSVLDSMRLSFWLLLMVALVRFRDGGSDKAGFIAILLASAFCVSVVGYEFALAIAGTTEGPPRHLHDVLRVGLGVAGLLAAENLLRNSDQAQRRNVFPLCLGLGEIFAFELFLYADRLIVAGVGPVLVTGRGLSALIAVPLLAVAMARNREWRIDIHVSRSVVFHTVALVASGLFFLAIAAIGLVVRSVGGRWGETLQLITLVGAATLLIPIFGSRELRVFLKHSIAKHLFSHRFDYRAEWLRFVDTVSQPHARSDLLSARVIKALAQIVDSPAGLLWQHQDSGSYVCESGWNADAPFGVRLTAGHPFIGAFEGGNSIPLRSQTAARYWPAGPFKAWLAIPLTLRDEIVAFVILGEPAYLFSLDMETLDLLRAAGRQAASYLAEEKSIRNLMDLQMLNEYNKKFAFVIHDLKNLANQLDLTVTNAKKYFDNPEFRDDMMVTIANSVDRMKRLMAQLAQLKAGGGHASSTPVEPDAIIATIAEELAATGTAIETTLQADACRITVHTDDFHSILSHLINNAREAAGPGSPVVVASRLSQDNLIIDIVDEGPGIEEAYIRDELFRPFRSTKNGGLGIGAYQTRELLRMAGGELDVISRLGAGTTMRITLPMQRLAQGVSVS
jgi:putative PEP-CTERM system histidine kinase